MKHGKEDVKETIEELNEFIRDAKKYLVVGKMLAEFGKPVLVDILKIIMNTALGVRRELEPEIAKFSSLFAEARYRDFVNYTVVGFTKEQAFALMLAAVKPFNSEAFMNLVKDGAKSASTKS